MGRKKGPKVLEPNQKGFGVKLIEEALAYEFNAISKLEFLREGVKASFLLP